jgi:hypothetical protein
VRDLENPFGAPPPFQAFVGIRSASRIRSAGAFIVIS